MPDVKKVIKGLEEISDYFFSVYHHSKDREEINKAKDRCDAVEDALALLKAQEPVEPIPTTDDDWTCGHCGMSLVGYEELDAGGFTTVRHNFCPNCGRAVKWDAEC